MSGGGLKTKSSGKSAFRFLIPRKTALDDPVTRKFAERHGELIIWYGKDRRVVMYPCQHNELLNFVCIHPTGESEPASIEKDWNKEGHKSTLLDVYKTFDPALLALLAKADSETLKVWELLDMDTLPTWVHDRLALMGDAAHPFTPRMCHYCSQSSVSFVLTCP